MLSPALLGREAERHWLAAALADPDTPLVVLRGTSGIGKSALAAEALQMARERGALTGEGRHPDDAGGATARALGQALRGLLDAALDQLHDPQVGRASLRAALGPAGAILEALEPGFLSEEPVAEPAPLSGDGATERLTHAVLGFLRWLEGLGQPIVLLIDDWGRAGPAVGRLYGQVASAGVSGFTMLATERDDEACWVPAPRRDLGPLSRAALTAIAARRLGDDVVAAASVVELLGDRITPLALLQGITLLQGARALTPRPGGWALERAAALGALADDVSAAFVQRFMLRASGLRAVLEIVALHGDDLPRARLEAACGPRPVRDEVEELVAEGLLEQRGERLRLSHDSLRRAVLDAMPRRRRRERAARLADLLAREAPLGGADLMTALRLRLDAGLADADPAWIPLFLAGAGQARGLDAAGLARTLAGAAAQMQEARGAPTFAAAREAALASIQDGDLAEGRALAATMAQRAQGRREVLQAAEAAVFAARLSGDPDAAFTVGREVLGQTGFAVPARGSLPAIAGALVRMTLTPDRPPRERADPDPVAHRLLHAVGSLGFERDPGIAVILAARSATHAPLRGSAFAAALRSTITCLAGDWGAAVRWGETALARLERDEPLRAPALQLALQFGLGLRLEAEAHFALAERLQRLALEEGDLGVAAYANRDRALASVRRAGDLVQHRRVLAECRVVTGRFDDPATAPLIDALAQLTENLIAGGGEPWRLQGETFDSPRFEREAPEALLRVAMACMTFEATLANAYGAWETTRAVELRMGERFAGLRHHPVTSTWAFHTALARARLGLPVKSWETAVVRRSGTFNAGYRHRHLALVAERGLRRGRRGAFADYEAAVAAAQASGFRLEWGLTAAAATHAARAQGRPELAERFHRSAQAAWRDLGAWGLCEGPATDAARDAADAAPGLLAAGAERASRAKTRLLAGAAHELRTPLQGIQGLLDLAAEDPAAFDVERLRQAFGGLRAVVDDLTDLGAVEADQMRIVEAPFDLPTLIETEVALAAASAPAGAGAVRVEIAETARDPLTGDGGRIAQILRNLLSNAHKYGDGPVDVVADCVAEDLVLEVLDRGPGLSAADQSRLFQPFARGEAAPRAAGAGLGLAVSARLARRMGGELSADNRPEGGARFRLRLPRRAASPQAVAASPRPRRILLAEDVALSRETLAQLLERRGHQVTAVADGQAAFGCGEAGEYDLYLFDARMPGLTGDAALRALRAAGRSTPALIMTAAPDAALSERLVGLGDVRLLSKPVSVDDVTRLLDVGPERPAPGAADGAFAPAADEAVDAALNARCAAAQAAWGRRQMSLVREHAHAAAGLAAQFGRPSSAAAFAALEAAAASGDAAAVARQIEALVAQP